MPANRRQLFIVSAAIFLVAAGVRFLTWQDQRFVAGRVQSAVVANYQHMGRLLREGGVGGFLSRASPLAEAGHLGHPPGYPVLLAVVSRFAGESDAAMQWLQLLADAAAAVVIFLIARELLALSIATIAGLLAALSPQFAYNSVLLLPDSLAIVPILLAVFCLARACRRPRLLTICAAGALVGLSCWLRANALLLAPFLAAFVVPLLFPKGLRLRYALALAASMLAVIAPITIRNALVHRHFVPLSLGAGQTLLEGIGDYDPGGRRFGVPETDIGIMKMEAALFNRPDYEGALFEPDGIQRERQRLALGGRLIRSHPFWFAGVMMRRAASMLRLERAPSVSTAVPVAHAPVVSGDTPLVWAISPVELSAAAVSPRAVATLAANGQTLRLAGDDSKWGDQLVSPPTIVRGGMDYLIEVPLKLEQGRVLVQVKVAGRDDALTSMIVDPLEGFAADDEQPAALVRLSFASGHGGEVRVALSNAAARDNRRTVLHLGGMKLYALGESAHGWTRYPRLLIAGLQWFWKTAWMLPLALVGLWLLVRARRWPVLLVLLAVPAYYMCVQSALHTEYRYVLALYYFLFVFVAIALPGATQAARQGWLKMRIATDDTGRRESI